MTVARPALVYLIVYALLASAMPEMERSLLCGAAFECSTYAQLQRLGEYKSNVLKAAYLLSLWPFCVAAGAVAFVESGCFSMACFALACRHDPKMASAGTSKLHWHRLFRKHAIPAPRIIAYRRRGEVVLRRRVTCSTPGVCKPDKGMYGSGVRRATFLDFLDLRESDIFQEEVVPPRAGRGGATFRVCTFKCRSGVRIISIFAVDRFDSTIYLDEWLKLKRIGRRLCRMHALELRSAPLVGWDVMIGAAGCFVLEGNLGGSVGMHVIPSVSGLHLDANVAGTWLADLREAEAAGCFSPSQRDMDTRHGPARSAGAARPGARRLAF